MEEASPAFDMAQSIHAFGPEIRSLRLFFLTDGLTTLDELINDHDGDLIVSHHVWDLRRTYRATTSGTAHEPISIDFTDRVRLPSSLRDGWHRQRRLHGLPRGDTRVTPLPTSTRSTARACWKRTCGRSCRPGGKVNQGIRKTISEEPRALPRVQQRNLNHRLTPPHRPTARRNSGRRRSRRRPDRERRPDHRLYSRCETKGRRQPRRAGASRRRSLSSTPRSSTTSSRRSRSMRTARTG